MREMKVNRPDGARPYFFLKPPTTSLVGPGQPIVVPTDPGAKVDWEAELAVVIGRRARHVSESDALNYVACYSAINDISLRGPHRVQHPIGEPFQWDWLASKGADRSTPLGPGIRPAFLTGDPQQLDLRLWVNGVLKQEANTSDMVVSVAALIAAASDLVTLEPGDVIATGTPAGVGLPRNEFLHPGDLVEMEVGDFGRLSNPVVAETI
jgi:2-keto-4-pentenoate hydratase/2-oxohepta-3-ene-1,7-dioic acid hydratase in catechol pathway